MSMTRATAYQLARSWPSRMGTNQAVRAASAQAVGEAAPATPPVYDAISRLEEVGILREVTGRQRGKAYVYDQYLSLLNEGTEPLLRLTIHHGLTSSGRPRKASSASHAASWASGPRRSVVPPSGSSRAVASRPASARRRTWCSARCAPVAPW